MKTTNEIYEFTPKYTTIEVTGFAPEEVEKLRGKRVTIVLRDVCLEGAKYNFIVPSITETFAKLINTYWQDLTEEEYKQIKEILE